MKFSKKTRKRFWAKVDKTSSSNGCWLWIGTKINGLYGQISFMGKGKYAHRIAWEMCVGRIPVGMKVLHDCPNGDNPACVNPKHLWLGTNAQNSADMVVKGRSARGEKNANSVLTDYQRYVLIPKLNKNGLTQQEIADKLGTCQGVVSVALMDRNKRQGIGYKVHKPGLKVSDKDVKTIRRLKKKGWIQADIARLFKVSQALVSLLVRGKQRKNIPSARYGIKGSKNGNGVVK